MSTSDWEDWLPRTIASENPRGVTLWYLGCNGFVLKAADGTTLLIDPYLGIGNPPHSTRMIPIPFNPEDIREADAILVTHEHTDHIDGSSQAPILANTGASLYAPGESIAVAREEEQWTDKWDVDDDQLVQIEEGEKFAVGSFDITVGPANDPDATEPVSYIINHEEGTIFHGGDTKPGEELSVLGRTHSIDLAIVAFGTVGNLPAKDDWDRRERTRWYCDENEVIAIANALEADRLLPSHWDMWKGVSGDPTVLHHHASSWSYPRQLEIVEIGDRVEL